LEAGLACPNLASSVSLWSSGESIPSKNISCCVTLPTNDGSLSTEPCKKLRRACGGRHRDYSTNALESWAISIKGVSWMPWTLLCAARPALRPNAVPDVNPEPPGSFPWGKPPGISPTQRSPKTRPLLEMAAVVSNLAANPPKVPTTSGGSPRAGAQFDLGGRGSISIQLTAHP